MKLYPWPLILKRKIKYEKIKKIHSSNGIYIAISGHDDSSLLSVAILATKKKLSVDDRVEYFRKSMTSRYKDVMESHKYYDSTLYKRYLKAYLAEVSFFGFIDKKPFIQTVSFLAKECNGIITISSKIAKQEPMTLLGIYDHVQEVKINPPTTQEIVITKIIKNEMKHHPEIGNPIDFLILNAQGPEWKKIN